MQLGVLGGDERRRIGEEFVEQLFEEINEKDSV